MIEEQTVHSAKIEISFSLKAAAVFVILIGSNSSMSPVAPVSPLNLSAKTSQQPDRFRLVQRALLTLIRPRCSQALHNRMLQDFVKTVEN